MPCARLSKHRAGQPCVKTRHDRIDLDPDRRVREAITLVFSKFAEFQSIRQVHLWLRQEGIDLPAADYGPQGRHIVWKPPVYNTVHHLLTNPIYAGAVRPESPMFHHTWAWVA
jgi:hypothetical protein